MRKKQKYNKKYFKTKSGLLCRIYSNMRSRTLGRATNKPELYTGLEIMTREEFYVWANSSVEFQSLFERWERSGYKRWLVPSVDRKDGNRGYTIDNIQWLTFSENCAKAGRGYPGSEGDFNEDSATL